MLDLQIDKSPLIEFENGEDRGSVEISSLPPPYTATVHVVDKVSQRQVNALSLRDMRRRRCLILSLAATFVSMALLLICLLIWIFALRRHPPPMHRFNGKCEMLFAGDGHIPVGLPPRVTEDVEMDRSSARLHIPPMHEQSGPLIQKTIVFHLFAKRTTIIRHNGVCYVKPIRQNLLTLNLDETMFRYLNNAPGHKMRSKTELLTEHWFVSRTPIPSAMFFFTYGAEANELCNQLTLLRLISRSEYEEGIRGRVVQRNPWLVHNYTATSHMCVEKECVDETCPEGFVRHLDVHGCLQDCGCMRHPPLKEGVVRNGVLCPVLSGENCPLMCAWGFEKEAKFGCEVCVCAEPPRRVRRSLEAQPQVVMPRDFNGNSCPVVGSLFEGTLPGENNPEAIVDLLHSCEM